jgi:uncharacterized protein
VVNSLKYLFLFKLSDDKYAIWNSLNLKLAIGNSELQEAFREILLDNNKSENNSIITILKNAKVVLSEDQLITITRQLKETAAESNLGTLYISPTLRCNLSCDYCILSDLRKRNFKVLDLDNSEIKRVLNIFLRLTSHLQRQREIVIFGGEPFLVPEKVRLIASIIRKDDSVNNNNSRIDIVTNGSMITEEAVEIIRKYALFTIISADGKPKTNRKARGHYDVHTAIKKLSNAKLPFGLSVTVSKHNIDTLESDVLYLIDKYKPKDLGLNNYLHPLDPNSSNQLEVFGKEYYYKIPSLYEKVATFGIFIEPITRRISSVVEEVPRLKDCPACGSKIVVLPNDAIGRCEYFCLHKAYPLDPETLTDANPCSAELWNQLSPINWQSCENCECRCVCGGDCRYDGFCSTGNLAGRDPRRCDQDRMFLYWLINRLGELHASNESIVILTPKDKRKLYFNLDRNDPRLLNLRISRNDKP